MDNPSAPNIGGFENPTTTSEKKNESVVVDNFYNKHEEKKEKEPNVVVDYIDSTGNPVYEVTYNTDYDKMENNEVNDGDFIFNGFFIDTTSGDIQIETSVGKLKYLRNRFFYTITAEDCTSADDLIITLPYKISNPEMITINSKNGKMTYNDHYKLSEDGMDIRIDKKYVFLKEEQILELYIYDLK